MRLALEDSVCEKHGVTKEEAMILWITSRGFDIRSIMDSIVKKGLASTNLFEKGQLVLSSVQKANVNSIFIDSREIITPQLNRFDELAKKLIAIYKENGFKGKKSGTTYSWCDSVSIISKRLKVTWEEENFTDEQAIEVTKKYVEGFKSRGDYTYMKLLKYYICKDLNNFSKASSPLLCDISNLGEEETNNQDAFSRLCLSNGVLIQLRKEKEE